MENVFVSCDDGEKGFKRSFFKHHRAFRTKWKVDYHVLILKTGLKTGENRCKELWREPFPDMYVAWNNMNRVIEVTKRGDNFVTPVSLLGRFRRSALKVLGKCFFLQKEIDEKSFASSSTERDASETFREPLTLREMWASSKGSHPEVYNGVVYNPFHFLTKEVKEETEYTLYLQQIFSSPMQVRH